MELMAKNDRTYCCVPQCKSQGTKNPDLSFHQFPPESSKIPVYLEDGTKVLVPRKKEWIRILKIGKTVSKRAKVCSRHFTSADYISTITGGYQRPRLKPTAVPTCCLPVTPWSWNLNGESARKQVYVKGARRLANSEELKEAEELLHRVEEDQEYSEEEIEELTTEEPSELRLISDVKDLSDYVNLKGSLKDTSARCEEMPAKKLKARSGPVTILRLTPKKINEDKEVYYVKDDHGRKMEETSSDISSEADESPFCNEPSASSCDSSESTREEKQVDSQFIEEVYADYQETKQSLAETDEKLLELLKGQNKLIKKQNELCGIQNSLLESLLEKME